MDRPVNPLAVDAYLRTLLPEAGTNNAKALAETNGEYPYLYGMATVKLAEANREIARLEAAADERRQSDMEADEKGNR